MTVLDDNIALRNKYLEEHGLEIKDFGLNYQYPIIPSTQWDWYREHKFASKAIYRRAGLFLIYLNVQGEPYLLDEVPYGVVRFLGAPAGVPEGEKAPKVLSQWGRRSEIHFEPLSSGVPWESLPHGSKVIHCESLVKAKAVHKATGLPCVGYNGVHGYSSAKQGVELIHEYAEFAFDKMDNVILYDSDIHTNPKVQNARASLCHKLRHIANCALVSTADLPQRVSEDGPPSNWGPDDFLLEHGSDALLKIILNAEPYQDEEFSSLVEAMNERAFWVRGQNAVYDRERRALMKWSDATLAYRNINRVVVQGRAKRTVFGTDTWIQSAHRIEVDDVGYMYLGDETFERRGKSIANEYSPSSLEMGSDSLKDNDIVMQMLKRLFKDDDLEQMRSYLRFLKFTPEKPTSYCVLWSNLRGVGKGWFVDLARALIGYHDVSTSTADLLAEKYNLHTVNCRLLIVHEFQASSNANKKAALNYLKNYMGDEVITVRAMNRNPYDAEVRSGLLITTNDKYNMPSDGLGDRRQWYVEGGSGLSERGLELWAPEAHEWERVWAALKDHEVMGRVARWVWEGAAIDFRSWRPPMTEERLEDLMEGQPMPVQIAREVLADCRELGVRVLDPKAIRQLMQEKMEGHELNAVGKGFGKILREAGWWTHKDYERLSSSKSAVWFTAPLIGTLPHSSNVYPMLREDALKIARKY